MTTLEPGVRNYFKLELLIARLLTPVRRLFKERYSLFNGGQVWDDTLTCGSNYTTNVVAKKKIKNLTKIQEQTISKGDSNEWDLTLLTTILLYGERPTGLNATEIQELDDTDKLLTQIKTIRNHSSHNANKTIADVEFDKLWTELSGILVTFGDVDTEIDKLKDDSVFEPCTEPINEENVTEALRLNLLGRSAHKNEKFSEAITFFTKATVLSGVSKRDRAVFYSNMASSRLALYKTPDNFFNIFVLDDPTDQWFRALRDAKQARTLWPTWWKGHFRVGKVYTAMNEHEKAINSFERALVLAPTNNKIQKALDESRAIHGEQLQKDHLDPILKPKTFTERLNKLQQKLGVGSEQMQINLSLIEERNPVEADVIRGHKYEHGYTDTKQDYEQAAKYFAKASSQGNAEGMYNLARLTGRGLGVKKDHNLATKLYEQAANQPLKHPIFKGMPNIGVVAAEHALGLRYAEGVGVQKNPGAAVRWYQRAADHGSAQSANNLAVMYQQGIDIEKNLDKAEQLFQLSAGGGDPNVMLTLVELLLDKTDYEMSQNSRNGACESGSSVPQMDQNAFEKVSEQKQESVDKCSLKTDKTINKQTDDPYIYYYDVLNEYPNCGSITAKRMCDAIDHFGEALNILTQAENLTEKQENTFIHELSQCYRIEYIVAQIPSMKMRKKTNEIVNRVLHRCGRNSNTVTLQLDEDVRICYAALHTDSHEEISKFLVACEKKYPKVIHFFELSAVRNRFLEQYERSLYDADAGLQIDPTSHELLYSKAVALQLLGKDIDETIEAYRTFLAVAPSDHPKVPDSYYAMAHCYRERHINDGLVDIIKKTYQKGEDAEKIQLPCFLPYESRSKTILKYLCDENLLSNTESTPLINRKKGLTDPHRIEIILEHREWESGVLQMTNKSDPNLIENTHEPQKKQKAATSLIGLNAISLREMDPTKDHVYNGYALSVTIIEETSIWTPSIHLVIEDEHFDCQKIVIVGFPEAQGKYLTTQKYTIGSKMNITNPYLRSGTNGMKPFIRIDDFSSILMQNEEERILNICRFCGEPNAPRVCSKCKKAHYCTKECETMDWELYKHKLICRK